MPTNQRRIADRPLVIDDLSFWYDPDEHRSGRMFAELADMGAEYVSGPKIESQTFEWLGTYDFGPRDLVILPTMSGALLYSALCRLQTSRKFQLGSVTRSHHPIDTLVFDTPESLQRFRDEYGHATRLNESLLNRTELGSRVDRLFYCDVTTALGQDAAAFLEGHDWVSVRKHLSFYNCTGDALGLSPGSALESKVARPSGYHTRLRGFDAVRVSSLALASKRLDGRSQLPRSVQPFAGQLIGIVSAACNDFPPTRSIESSRRRSAFLYQSATLGSALINHPFECPR